MASRPAKLSEGGGGKFNNVDGIIKDYEFTTEHPFAKDGRRSSKSDFEPLYGVLTAQMDGTKDPDVDVLLLGDAKDFEVSDNGRTVTPAEGRGVWSKSQWGKFIASLEKLGVETENADYDEDVYNYEPILNRRVRFGQEQQFDKLGKVKRRKYKGKDGKEREIDDTTTVVTADYGYAEVAGKGRKAATVTKAAGGRSNGKAVEVPSADALQEDGLKAIKGLLAKFGGSAPKAKLVSAPGQLYLKKEFPENADEVRKLIITDEFLAAAEEAGVIAYDAIKEVVSAA